MANQTPVDICNQALGWVGANLITSQEFDSPSSKEAQLCHANYAALRDAVLEDHPWSFAVKRVVLTPHDDPLEGKDGYLYGDKKRFHMPADVLRMLDVATDSKFNEFSLLQDYTVEDKDIIAGGSDVLYLRAIFRITDTGKMSPNFTQALAARMAMDFAIPLTNSRAMFESMQAMYGVKLHEARTTDGMQGSDRRITSNWLRRARMR